MNDNVLNPNTRPPPSDLPSWTSATKNQLQSTTTTTSTNEETKSTEAITADTTTKKFFGTKPREPGLRMTVTPKGAQPWTAFRNKLSASNSRIAQSLLDAAFVREDNAQLANDTLARGSDRLRSAFNKGATIASQRIQQAGRWIVNSVNAQGIITEYKQGNTALRQSQEYYEDLLKRGNKGQFNSPPDPNDPAVAIKRQQRNQYLQLRETLQKKGQAEYDKLLGEMVAEKSNELIVQYQSEQDASVKRGIERRQAHSQKITDARDRHTAFVMDNIMKDFAKRIHNDGKGGNPSLTDDIIQYYNDHPEKPIPRAVLDYEGVDAKGQPIKGREVFPNNPSTEEVSAKAEQERQAAIKREQEIAAQKQREQEEKEARERPSAPPPPATEVSQQKQRQAPTNVQPNEAGQRQNENTKPPPSFAPTGSARTAATVDPNSPPPPYSVNNPNLTGPNNNVQPTARQSVFANNPNYRGGTETATKQSNWQPKPRNDIKNNNELEISEMSADKVKADLDKFIRDNNATREKFNDSEFAKDPWLQNLMAKDKIDLKTATIAYDSKGTLRIMATDANGKQNYYRLDPPAPATPQAYKTPGPTRVVDGRRPGPQEQQQVTTQQVSQQNPLNQTQVQSPVPLTQTVQPSVVQQQQQVVQQIPKIISNPNPNLNLNQAQQPISPVQQQNMQPPAPPKQQVQQTPPSSTQTVPQPTDTTTVTTGVRPLEPNQQNMQQPPAPPKQQEPPSVQAKTDAPPPATKTDDKKTGTETGTETDNDPAKKAAQAQQSGGAGSGNPGGGIPGGGATTNPQQSPQQQPAASFNGQAGGAAFTRIVGAPNGKQPSDNDGPGPVQGPAQGGGGGNPNSGDTQEEKKEEAPTKVTDKDRQPASNDPTRTTTGQRPGDNDDSTTVTTGTRDSVSTASQTEKLNVDDQIAQQQQPVRVVDGTKPPVPQQQETSSQQPQQVKVVSGERPPVPQQTPQQPVRVVDGRQPPVEPTSQPLQPEKPITTNVVTPPATTGQNVNTGTAPQNVIPTVPTFTAEQPEKGGTKPIVVNIEEKIEQVNEKPAPPKSVAVTSTGQETVNNTSTVLTEQPPRQNIQVQRMETPDQLREYYQQEKRKAQEAKKVPVNDEVPVNTKPSPVVIPPKPNLQKPKQPYENPTLAAYEELKAYKGAGKKSQPMTREDHDELVNGVYKNAPPAPNKGPKSALDPRKTLQTDYNGKHPVTTVGYKPLSRSQNIEDFGKVLSNPSTRDMLKKLTSSGMVSNLKSQESSSLTPRQVVEAKQAEKKDKRGGRKDWV